MKFKNMITGDTIIDTSKFKYIYIYSINLQVNTSKHSAYSKPDHTHTAKNP